MAGEGSEGVIPPAAEVKGDTASAPTTDNQEAVINHLISEVDQLHQREEQQSTVDVQDTSSGTAASEKPSGTQPLTESSQKPSLSENKIEQPASPGNTMTLEMQINSNPEMKRMYEDRLKAAVQTNGGIEELDRLKMQNEIINEWSDAKLRETTQSAEITPEQRKIYEEQFKQAFQEHPFDILTATKQATELAKAKINEAKLQNDQTATQEAKNKASQTVAKVQNKYNLILEKIKAKLPKNSPVNELLQKSPNNRELLRLMQDKSKTELLKLLAFFLIPLEPLTEEGQKAIEDTVAAQ